jgi:DNA-binding transcriptional ArsR family regulator
MTITEALSHTAKLSVLFQAISPESRLEILLSIGTGEACVCHLEAKLGYRQAYISQQLMALRETGLLSTRRDGRYIFYRLEKPEILEMVSLGARLAGVDVLLASDKTRQASTSCDCPKCSPQLAIQATASA